jgi:hypothetical protein
MCEKPAFPLADSYEQIVYLWVLLVFGCLLLASTASRGPGAGSAAGAHCGRPTPPKPAVVTPEAKRKEAADLGQAHRALVPRLYYKGIRLTRPGKAALLAVLLTGEASLCRYWKPGSRRIGRVLTASTTFNRATGVCGRQRRGGARAPRMSIIWAETAPTPPKCAVGWSAQRRFIVATAIFF